MSQPTRYEIGDKVIITPECMERMRWHSRQAAHPGHPTASFLSDAQACIGVEGVVTYAFPPGHEVTAMFGDRSFHMKDNWMVKLSSGTTE